MSKKTISSIDAKINNLEDEIIKAKEKYDSLVKELKKLQVERSEFISQELS